MPAATYRLPDEPMPSGLSRYAVDPLWPLLTLMLAGNIFGLAWFLFNSLALGSPTRAREWIWAGSSLVGSLLLLLLLQQGQANGWIQDSELRYANLSVIILKMGVGYALYLMQSRCFEIWEHFGGQPRNGAIPTIAFTLLGTRLLKSMHLPALLLGVVQ